MTDYIVPGILAVCSVFALWKKENSYDLMVQGAREGLRTVAAILPALVILLSAVQMLKTSGAMDLLIGWLTPAFAFLGIPPETAPLVLIRPLPGSAALAVGAGRWQPTGWTPPSAAPLPSCWAAPRLPFIPSVSISVPQASKRPAMPSPPPSLPILQVSSRPHGHRNCFSELIEIRVLPISSFFQKSHYTIPAKSGIVN